MRSDQCIVIEKTRNQITVLTSDGRFLQFPTKNCIYIVGEQVSLSSLSELPAKHRSWGRNFAQFLTKRLVPVTLLASLILFASFFGYTQYLEARPALAWVTLDLVDSPGSLELEVNDRGLIRSVTCFDETGEKIAVGHDLYMKPVDQAVEALIKTKEEGEQPEVVIGIIPIKEGAALDNLEKKILKDAQKAAEKTAREAAKAAEKAAKEAAKQAGKKPKFEKQAPASQQIDRKTKANHSVINHVRLDMQAREAAKQLKISAARAALWALFEEEGYKEPSHTEGFIDDTPDKEVPESNMAEQGEPGKNKDKDNGKDKQEESQNASQEQPPGQLKKQTDFKSNIPRPGIDKIKDKGSNKDKGHLSKLTKQWVKEIQKSQEKALKDKAKAAKDKLSEQKGSKQKDHKKGNK